MLHKYDTEKMAEEGMMLADVINKLNQENQALMQESLNHVASTFKPEGESTPPTPTGPVEYQNMFDWMQEMFKKIIKWVVEAYKKSEDLVKRNVYKALKTIKELMNNTAQRIEMLCHEIMNYFLAVEERLRELFHKFVRWIKENGELLIEMLGSVMQRLLDPGSRGLSTFVHDIISRCNNSNSSVAVQLAMMAPLLLIGNYRGTEEYRRFLGNNVINLTRCGDDIQTERNARRNQQNFNEDELQILQEVQSSVQAHTDVLGEYTQGLNNYCNRMINASEY